MDAQLKAKWVEALRSGKYEQGKNQLRLESGFCCLGVLCDVIDPSKWEDVATGYRYKGKDYAALSYLPSDVSHAIGLPESLIEVVVTMNDDGQSFGEIAAYIEQNL